MARWQYEKGLHDLGRGAYAWLQPDGNWGWSNAGLVTDGEAALLVDTLFDAALTAEMLAVMRRAAPAAERIGTLVNTHANADHYNGNGLVPGAEIIASEATAREMAESPPDRLAQLMRAAQGMGAAGRYLEEIFGAFDFENVAYALPTRTFERTLEVPVGGKTVRLVEVGPAHTRGDILVHVPEDGLVFTGDILFIDSTPIMWQGPVENWIRACRLIEEMEVETVVPGHGPITDRRGAAQVRGYLEYIGAEARKRYDAGLGPEEAAKDIALGDYGAWGDAERIAVNVHSLYREYGADVRTDTMELFALMAKLRR